jgi:hypothetical protein
METLLRGLEKYVVIPVANTTERDDLLTGGLLHDGQIIYITGADEFQARLDGAWRSLLAIDERNTDHKTVLGDATGELGRVRYRESDDSLWVSYGTDWYKVGGKDVRLAIRTIDPLPDSEDVDAGSLRYRGGAYHVSNGAADGWTTILDDDDTKAAKGANSTSACTTSSVGGTEDPTSGGVVDVTVKCPRSEKFLVTVSTQMYIDNTSGEAFCGFEARHGGSTVDAFNKPRACRTNRAEVASYSWTSQSSPSGITEDDDVTFRLVHAVDNGARTAHYASREITVVPVK